MCGLEPVSFPYYDCHIQSHLTLYQMNYALIQPSALLSIIHIQSVVKLASFTTPNIWLLYVHSQQHELNTYLYIYIQQPTKYINKYKNHVTWINAICKVSRKLFVNSFKIIFTNESCLILCTEHIKILLSSHHIT